MVEDLGEVNMATGQTLVDFVTWAMENYPADHYVLILSDHGMGWPGGWSDPTAAAGDDSRTPAGSGLGRSALPATSWTRRWARSAAQTGLDAFELMGMDACLMGHVEVLTMLACPRPLCGGLAGNRAGAGLGVYRPS